jgi:hypothetical protein
MRKGRSRGPGESPVAPQRRSVRDVCAKPRSPAGVRRRHGTIWWRVLRSLLPLMPRRPSNTGIRGVDATAAGGAPSRGRHARRDGPAIPANRCSRHGPGKRLSAVLGRPALAEEAVQPLAKARTRIGAVSLLLREMPLAMLLADRRPARIMAPLLIRVQAVSLPGVVQREIDGVLAWNYRAPVRGLADLDAVGLHANVSPECPRAGGPQPVVSLNH